MAAAASVDKALRLVGPKDGREEAPAAFFDRLELELTFASPFACSSSKPVQRSLEQRLAAFVDESEGMLPLADEYDPQTSLVIFFVVLGVTYA